MTLPRPMTILLVDDDPDDRYLTKEAFNDSPLVYNVHEAVDGEDGLAFLRREGEHADAPRPDLILLDLNMPRMDGRETLAAIKGDPDLRSIPVVVLTTSKAEQDIVKSYELGANSFIMKPVGFESFTEAMRDLSHYWFQTVDLPDGRNG
jgi:two-component system, response regulator